MEEDKTCNKCYHCLDEEITTKRGIRKEWYCLLHLHLTKPNETCDEWINEEEGALIFNTLKRYPREEL